jgi:hypothetical protein
MSKSIKTKIYQMVDSIQDESILNQVMEDVTFYATKKDPVEDLNPEQLKELDDAIGEADRNNTISFSDFKKELKEWKGK